jgi:hypothetical protein
MSIILGGDDFKWENGKPDSQVHTFHLKQKEEKIVGVFIENQNKSK